MTLFPVIVSRIRGFFRPDGPDQDFGDELEAHLEMAAADNMDRGMTPEQARRAARVELGGVQQLREATRLARGLPHLDTFWLDVKLGLRMLRKYWGLTLIAGLAMTVAIGIGAVAFEFVDTLTGTALPLAEGDRVVVLQTWDAAAQGGGGSSRRDFARWRDQLRSFEDIGAFRVFERNLVVADGPAGPVTLAEMTASGFRLTRVQPLLGRPLVDEDERVGADPVVVIGYDVWQSRFAGNTAVLGQTVRIGTTVHTVVGIMPEDFGFPLNQQYWIPLQTGSSDDLLEESRWGLVFARLAPGVTLDGSQAELTSMGLLAPIAVPDENEQLQPRVGPYATAFTGNVPPPWLLRLILFIITLLLVPPCANVAILVYARTVTRQEEFAARYALGASRGRIVVQLFVEMLVLATGAAALALLLAQLFIWQVHDDFIQRGSTFPFWMDFSLSPSTVLFAAGLAVLASLIAGGVPALQVTGRLMQSGLHALGSPTRVKLGATWTVLVVIQVAFSFALLPTSVEVTWGTIRAGLLGPGFASEEILTAQLVMGSEPEPPAAESVDLEVASRFLNLRADLVRQLESETGVLGVAVTGAVPGTEPWVGIEVDRVTAVSDRAETTFEPRRIARLNQVDDGFFEVFDLRILTGRGFNAGDFEPGRAAVIVNQSFVSEVVGPSNPLGQRLRYTNTGSGEGLSPSESERRFEIVGVVEDLDSNKILPTIYQPEGPGQMHPVTLNLRVASNQAGIVDRLLEITTALDPNLRADELRTLDEIYRGQAVGNYLGASALVTVTLSVLLLSAAGMYAFMSFTVNQRRREIGIRSALGAQPRRLLAGILRRALGQVAAGAIGGVLVALLVGYYIPVEQMDGWDIPGIIPAAAALLVAVGLLAVVGPARRALLVDPTEALRDG